MANKKNRKSKKNRKNTYGPVRKNTVSPAAPAAPALKKGLFRSLAGVLLHPYSEGEAFVDSRNTKASVLAVVMHALCSGLFFLTFFSRVDTAVHSFILQLTEKPEAALEAISENSYVFLDSKVLIWVEKIPVIGERLRDSSEKLIQNGITVITESVQNWIDNFSRELSESMRFSLGMPFGLGLLLSLTISIVFILLLVVFLKILRHRWGGFSNALSLSAIRSTVMIPFALLSILLTLIHPVLGIFVFSLGLLWCMLHVYTTLLSAADKKSGDRAALFYPVLFLIVYLLTAAAAAVILILTFAAAVQNLNNLAAMLPH